KSLLLPIAFRCTGPEKSLCSIQRVTAEITSVVGGKSWKYRWEDERKFIGASQAEKEQMMDKTEYVSRVSQFVVPADSSVIKLIEFWPTDKGDVPNSDTFNNSALVVAVDSDTRTVKTRKREYTCGKFEREKYNWC